MDNLGYVTEVSLEPLTYIFCVYIRMIHRMHVHVPSLIDLITGKYRRCRNY